MKSVQNRAKLLAHKYKIFPAAALATALLSCASLSQAQTIRVAIPHYSNQTLPYFKKQVEEFKRLQPGITIKLEEVNWDSLQQKLQTDLAGANPPDLAIIGTRWLVDMVKDEVVEPLDNRMSADFRQKFIGRFLDSGKVKDKVYGLPIAASVRGMYVNNSLLEKAGVKQIPQNWQEVASAAEKVKAQGAYGFGIQGKEIETEIYWLYAFWSFGGELINAQGKLQLDTPAGLKAAQLYRQMITQNLTQAGVTSSSREDLHNLFKQGRLAMLISAPFLAKQIQQEKPALNFSVAVIPHAGQPASFATTDSLVLFKDSKQKNAAWLFSEFLFSKSARVAFSRGEGFLPTTQEEANDPAFADNINKSFISFLPNARFVPMVAGWDDVAKVLSNNLQALYLAKQSPEAAIKNAQLQGERALKK